MGWCILLITFEVVGLWFVLWGFVWFGLFCWLGLCILCCDRFFACSLMVDLTVLLLVFLEHF